MTIHSSILARRIPWTEEHGGPLSLGAHRDGYDSRDFACTRTHVAKTDGSL